MSTRNTAVVPPECLVEQAGTDGIVYCVMPLQWTLENVEKYWEKFRPYKILSDDIRHDRNGFERFVVSSGAVWFEVLEKETGKDTGIIYVADFAQSFTENRYISASFHVSMWDSKIGSRMPVLKAAVRALFAQFRLHRLEMEIPLFAGGAIRVAKKAGFVEEGVRRQARRYSGQWWNVLHLAMLESEVPQNG
jgi:RimJ/RimL family protein N-acetyltransferase